MKTAKVIISVAAAAAAGVAIGMLIAPEKGEQLQKKITDGARTWFGEILALIGTAKHATDEAKNESDSESSHRLEESNINNERA